MISYCALSGGFSPEIFCFPLLYLLPFGEITILLKMLFEKKRYYVLFSRTIAESDFCFVFLIYVSIKWQWFSHYGQICFWRGNISTAKLHFPALRRYIYNTLKQLISTIVLLCELPRIPSSSSRRSRYGVVLVMPCPWRPHLPCLFHTHRFLQSFWGLLTGQKTFVELETLIYPPVAWEMHTGFWGRYTSVWSGLHRFLHWFSTLFAHWTQLGKT